MKPHVSFVTWERILSAMQLLPLKPFDDLYLKNRGERQHEHSYPLDAA